MDTVAVSATGVVTVTGWNPLQTTQMGYDPVGNRTQVLAAAGTPAATLTQTRYDADDRPLCVAVRMNPTSAALTDLYNASATPDACASPTTTGPNADRITKTVYDAAGQVTQVIQALGTADERTYATYTYTASGKQATIEDARHNRTTLRYDGFDRLCRQEFPAAAVSSSASNGPPAPQGQGYLACRATLAEAQATTSGDFEEYGYDANGNQTWRRKRDNGGLSYTYDALNRMTVKSGTNIATVNSAYDLTGKPTDIAFGVDGPGIHYDYDTAGRLTSEKSYGRELKFEYDAAGNRTKVAWPDTAYAAYDYDAANQPRSTAAGASSITYIHDDLDGDQQQPDRHGRRPQPRRHPGDGGRLRPQPKPDQGQQPRLRLRRREPADDGVGSGQRRPGLRPAGAVAPDHHRRRGHPVPLRRRQADGRIRYQGGQWRDRRDPAAALPARDGRGHAAGVVRGRGPDRHPLPAPRPPGLDRGLERRLGRRPGHLHLRPLRRAGRQLGGRQPLPLHRPGRPAGAEALSLQGPRLRPHAGLVPPVAEKGLGLISRGRTVTVTRSLREMSGIDKPVTTAVPVTTPSSTLTPGPFANGSIPARGPGRDFTPGERAATNENMAQSGCHTCGTRDPGTKSGNAIPDHQPASGLNPPGGQQQLYPHCLGCSTRQMREVRQEQLRRRREEQ
ncbi:MAG: hypothetical protein JF617_02290 [Burkholderiales bacterium]|nr:hypothetical protein [Burkholderiales bacterium]